MERTFYPSREYWSVYISLLILVLFLLEMIIGMTVADDHGLRSPKSMTPARAEVFWFLIAFGAIYLLANAIYGVLAYWRKRLIILEDAILYHGPLFVRRIRFADIIDARWNWNIEREQPHGIILCTTKRELRIYFAYFAQRGAQVELIDLFRRRLGPPLLQDSERIQAVREGRASFWGPGEFTIKPLAKMLAFAMALSVVVGAVIGHLLQSYPGVSEWWADAVRSGEIRSTIKILGIGGWPWSGSLPLDWGLMGGIWGLVGGSLFLGFFWFLEWSGRKWRTYQGRRLERALAPPPESHDD